MRRNRLTLRIAFLALLVQTSSTQYTRPPPPQTYTHTAADGPEPRQGTRHHKASPTLVDTCQGTPEQATHMLRGRTLALAVNCDASAVDSLRGCVAIQGYCGVAPATRAAVALRVVGCRVVAIKVAR